MTETRRRPAGEQLVELVAELLDVYDDNRSTTPLLARVRALVPPGASPPRDTGEKRTKAEAAPSPVSDGPLFLLDDVQRGARYAEQQLRHALGFGRLVRGGSSANSYAALRSLPALVAALEHRETEHYLADETLELVRGWRRRALSTTRLVEPWARLKGHVCPYCKRDTLRQRPTDGALVCMSPVRCRDAEGRRHEWQLDDFLRELLEAETPTEAAS